MLPHRWKMSHSIVGIVGRRVSWLENIAEPHRVRDNDRFPDSDDSIWFFFRRSEASRHAARSLIILQLPYRSFFPLLVFHLTFQPKCAGSSSTCQLAESDQTLSAADMNDANNGCGSNGRLLSSGWNCTPMNHGWSRSSTISGSKPSGLIPENQSPLLSSRWR